MPGSRYHPFERGDVRHVVVTAHPRAAFVSGTMGWRGSLGESGSLSLYAGVRSRRDIGAGNLGSSGVELYPLDPEDTGTIDGVRYISGSYPATASIAYVRARTAEAADFSDVTGQDWYAEHWRPIELLYDFYARSRPALFFTGSYDYYSLRFVENTSSLATLVSFTGNSLPTVTSSFTFEARLRPLQVTGSRDFTVMSQPGKFNLYITGSSGKLVFSNGVAMVTSSAALTRGPWQHVAAVGNGTSWTLYVDGTNAGSLTPGNAAVSSSSSPLVVGAQTSSAGRTKGLDGFVMETRAWSIARTAAQVSGSSQRLLRNQASASLSLVHYARYNDGPLATSHGQGQGVGVRDHSQSGDHGLMVGFGATLPQTPVWHPCDDRSFTTLKRRAEGTPSSFRAVHLPSLFYGRQVSTGSVRLECRAYDRQGIVRVLLDDGMGGLYLSGSAVRPVSQEDGPGVTWNKVGNVFYSEGLFVITDPALQDFGDVGLDSSVTGTLHVSYAGQARVPSMVFDCHLDAAAANASNNPTYVHLDDRGDDDPTNDRYVLNRDEATTWVTAVGLYDGERNLVAVAKLASPLRKRERDRNTIRLKFDV